MSSKKITDLTSYSAAELSASSGTDLLFITDIANQETKKITAIQFGQYVVSVGGSFTGSFTGSLIGNFTGSSSGSLNGTSSWANYALTASYAPSAGEANTASSTGSYGYGLVSDKVGVDLRFKKIGQGSNVIIAPDPNDNNVLVISASTTTAAGGSTGNIQFRSLAGTFSGNGNLTWDINNNNLLTVVGGIASTSFTSSITNAVGFLGTASFAISASNASSSISSSYALSSSYSVTSSYAATAGGSLGGSGFAGLDSSIYYTSTSTNTLDTYYNTYYFVNHGFAAAPSLIRVTLICQVTDQGYSVNDEISVEQLHDDTGGADDERPITTIWASSSQVGIAWAAWSGGVYAHAKTGGRATLDPTKWKIKIRTWK